MNLTINSDLDVRLAEREWMVQTQLIGRDITDERVIHSMLIVPRHKYVVEDKQAYAYDDTALQIEAGQTIMSAVYCGTDGSGVRVTCERSCFRNRNGLWLFSCCFIQNGRIYRDH